MAVVNKTKLTLTKEQYDKLNTEELRWFLKTAYYSKFITGLTMKQAKELFDLYNEVFNERKKYTSCSQCRLDVCMRLGKLFFEYEEELKNEEENDLTEEQLEKLGDEINEAIINDIKENEHINEDISEHINEHKKQEKRSKK